MRYWGRKLFLQGACHVLWHWCGRGDVMVRMLMLVCVRSITLPTHTFCLQVGQQRELIAAKLDLTLSSPSESEPSVMFHPSWGGLFRQVGCSDCQCQACDLLSRWYDINSWLNWVDSHNYCFYFPSCCKATLTLLQQISHIALKYLVRVHSHILL